jgi:hypothetical protein
MFTSKEFTMFSEDVEKALEVIAAKYNVNIDAGKIKYSDTYFDMNLKVTKKEVNGQSFEQAEFYKLCKWYGLKPEDYKKQFKSNGKIFEIYGINPKAKTMPVLARCLTDGQNYKFGADTVKRLMVS